MGSAERARKAIEEELDANQQIAHRPLLRQAFNGAL